MLSSASQPSESSSEVGSEPSAPVVTIVVSPKKLDNGSCCWPPSLDTEESSSSSLSSVVFSLSLSLLSLNTVDRPRMHWITDEEGDVDGDSGGLRPLLAQVQAWMFTLIVMMIIKILCTCSRKIDAMCWQSRSNFGSQDQDILDAIARSLNLQGLLESTLKLTNWLGWLSSQPNTSST